MITFLNDILLNPTSLTGKSNQKGTFFLSILHVQQMLNHSILKHVHLYTKMMPIDLKKAHAKLRKETKEPTRIYHLRDSREKSRIF